MKAVTVPFWLSLVWLPVASCCSPFTEFLASGTSLVPKICIFFLFKSDHDIPESGAIPLAVKPSLLFWYWWKLLAFCWFPSGLPWHRRCLRLEGAWRYLTSHWYFVHVRGLMVLVQGNGFSCLQVVRDHMSCLADHNSPFSCTAPLVCSCPCLLHRLCWAETAFLCTQLQIKSWAL